MTMMSAARSMLFAVGVVCDTTMLWSMVADAAHRSAAKIGMFSDRSQHSGRYFGAAIANGSSLLLTDDLRPVLIDDSAAAGDNALSWVPANIGREVSPPAEMFPYAGTFVTFPIR
jgi:hypothetical protein